CGLTFMEWKRRGEEGGGAGGGSDAAMGVWDYDNVKPPAASRDLFGNLADSSEQTQLLQQPGSDSTANITHHDCLARFDSKYMSRIHTHIGATDDDRPNIRQRPRKRGHQCARSRLPSGKILVAFQHGVKSAHGCPPSGVILGLTGSSLS